ncbi:CidA/LrgA family protein [Planococcus lenghuensis]|uniref:CidA/LrgA family holin-like protein n=1 Tax=Planococcus lenghuensis TaxID=2213202 RepID=A0A1Q2KUU4_9BACL|nr:CidA/LrgA family protein [Planococcus lenghuensis]AQQ51896.1 hypothetical protein B0X71_01360 [Planococcus lenghuensis]
MAIRKLIQIVVQAFLLYLIFLLGEAVANIFKLIIPGSIVGLLILLAGLLTRIVPVVVIEDGAKAFLLFLPLFFVPATVGIIQYPEFLSLQGALLIFMVVLSTCISLVAAGWASQLFENRKKGRQEI